MDLTASLVEEKAREYERREPLFAVERDNVETLPGAFRDGEYTWKDAEWIVQWYYRRFLGEFPDAERRSIEEAYKGNDFETVAETLDAVLRTDEPTAKVRRLTTLDGIDVPVASAFLAFLFPDRYVVVGRREWRALYEAGELNGPYPASPSIEEYETYRSTCRTLAESFAVDLWTLYRALWRLGKA